MPELSNLSEADASRLNDALIYYTAITGEIVEAGDLFINASLAQTVTSMMADIYRKDIRAKIFGFDSEG